LVKKFGKFGLSHQARKFLAKIPQKWPLNAILETNLVSSSSCSKNLKNIAKSTRFSEKTFEKNSRKFPFFKKKRNKFQNG